MSAAAVSTRPRFGEDVIAFYARARDLAAGPIGAVLDLAVRLLLAQGFLVSGLLKVSDWPTALYLAEHEYPVPWASPATAAVLGAAVELVGAVLLALGLGTRLAAAALLALTLVIQLEYRALDPQLFWAALLALQVARGAGPVSLDRALARGLARSAVPLASPALRALSAFTRVADPASRLGIRVFLAAPLLLAAAGNGPQTLLPVGSASALAGTLASACALLLALGLATRAAALGTLAVAAGVAWAGDAGDFTAWWIVAPAVLVCAGPGGLSLDTLLHRAVGARYPQLEGRPAFTLDGLPHVVVVGAGFGGLACVAGLAGTRVRVTLIDRHNYHLFQPLLYQVATASLSPGDIATPVRGLLREQLNARVLLGEVSAVDAARREVHVGAHRIAYDYLVLATGAAHSYFGRDEWAPHAPGLKRVEDATEVRRRLLLAFERAEATDDPEERRALLTFLVVGGGPTGVELAGAIAELARFGMERDFRGFDPATARVVLVQAGPRLLPTFPEDLSGRTRRALERLGVEVLLDSRVEGVDAAGVLVDGRRIAAATVLWAAGVVASPAARWLGAVADAAGRVRVADDLSVPGLPEVFAVGDTALCLAWAGHPVPGLAPAAKQGGAYVARVIRSRAEGRPRPGPFVYRHLGSLATIGRKAAVVHLGRVKLAGGVAWWLWGAVHVAFLVGLRNRVSVMFDWLWAYLTYRGGTRLITGMGHAPEVTSAPGLARTAPAGPLPASPGFAARTVVEA